MKLLLTGCTGFIGRELIPLLIEEGHSLTIISRQSKEKLKAIEPHSPSAYVLKRVSMWENMSLEELVEDIRRFDGGLKGIISTFEGKDD